MRLTDAVKTASHGLTHAKGRSILTMLGIVIGISSVIVLMSIGQSAQDLILNQVKNIGSNLIFIVPGATKGSRFASPPSVQGVVIKTLIKADADSFKKEPTIEQYRVFRVTQRDSKDPLSLVLISMGDLNIPRNMRASRIPSSKRF